VCIANVLWKEPSCGTVETIDIIRLGGESELSDVAEERRDKFPTDAGARENKRRQ